MIEKITIRGEELINVPAEKSTLLELGLQEAEADAALRDYRTKKELDKIREVRAPLLIEADHLVNLALDKDLDIVPFRQYRQALRDITEHYQELADVVWPVKPTI